jgi:hypothetical protein
MPGTSAPSVDGVRATRFVSRNPADLQDVVAEVDLAAAADLVAAARAGARGTARLGRRPCTGPRAGDRPGGPAGRGQQGSARRAGHPGGRQALRGGARRGAGGRRHLRLLPRRGPAALRPDCAERDARQVAVHLPHARRGGGDHHRRQLPGRRAGVVPRPGAAVRQHRGVEARGDGVGRRSCVDVGPARRGSALRRAASRRRRRPPRRTTGCRRPWTRAWSTRSGSPGRPRSAAASPSCAAGTCSHHASSSVARTRWS